MDGGDEEGEEEDEEDQRRKKTRRRGMRSMQLQVSSSENTQEKKLIPSFSEMVPEVVPKVLPGEFV